MFISNHVGGEPKLHDGSHGQMIKGFVHPWTINTQKGWDPLIS